MTPNTTITYDRNTALYTQNKSIEKHPEPQGHTFWMVIRLGSDGFTKPDAHPTREHPSYEEACAEAERLAAKHPTHARGFAVLQAQRIVKGQVSLAVTYLS